MTAICSICKKEINDDWVRVVKDGYQYHVGCYDRTSNQPRNNEKKDLEL
jgi:hypothetical protein